MNHKTLNAICLKHLFRKLESKESPRIASRLRVVSWHCQRGFCSSDFQFTYLWREHKISLCWRWKDPRSWGKEDRTSMEWDHVHPLMHRVTYAQKYHMRLLHKIYAWEEGWLQSSRRNLFLITFSCHNLLHIIQRKRFKLDNQFTKMTQRKVFTSTFVFRG